MKQFLLKCVKFLRFLTLFFSPVRRSRRINMVRSESKTEINVDSRDHHPRKENL